jgi:hypothetical protein
MCGKLQTMVLQLKHLETQKQCFTLLDNACCSRNGRMTQRGARNSTELNAVVAGASDPCCWALILAPDSPQEVFH